MRIQNKLFVSINLILATGLLFQPVLWGQRTKSSQRAGEQVKAEKGLKDNRYYFYFINASITNFGTDMEKRSFKEAIQRDIFAQLLYMKFLFMESYGEIRKSQKILIDLYRSILKRDIEDTRKLLNSFAPPVISSMDKTAQHYLRLGYRDMKVAETYLEMGDNFREDLFSMRLYKYVHAIKTAKHGKRYAFLCYIAFNRKKLEATSAGFFNQVYDTVMNALPNYEDYLSHREREYLKIERQIKRVAPSDSLAPFLVLHKDSYYKSRDSKSFYDQVWEDSRLEELEDYKKYRDTTE